VETWRAAGLEAMTAVEVAALVEDRAKGEIEATAVVPDI
jgi:enamine deaminase RidA (YjgF/YER057c/UK114 family)